MQELKQQLRSLAVSDLQLLIAFHLRNGIDLTNHMKVIDEGYLIEYSSSDDIQTIGEGVNLTAKFNKDGQTIFCKYSKPVTIVD